MAESDIIHHSTNSEVAGSFLQILIESFKQLGIVSQSQINAKTSDIDVTQWYSQATLVDVVKTIEQWGVASKHIMFQAGELLPKIWQDTHSSNITINSGLDWLYNFTKHPGYNSVVRGNQDEIGWCTLQKVDEKAGFASYESLSPLPPDYLKGVFYGGCTMFDDMEYVEVTATSKPYLANALFNHTTIVVQFRQKPQENGQDIDARVSHLQAGSLPSPKHAFTETEIESLVWRYKNLLVKSRLGIDYNNDIRDMLAAAISTNQQTAELLARCNTEMIAQRDTISRLANHDPVTGLASLRLGRDRLRMACHAAKRAKVRAAVMFIDLDGFKQANNQYGYAVGDAILKTVAERLIKSIRATDSAVRQGGDDFLVILSNFSEIEVLATIATRIISAIAEPLQHQDITFNIASKIGISVYPDDADTPEYLLKNADKALHSLGKSAKNHFAFYSPTQQN